MMVARVPKRVLAHPPEVELAGRIMDSRIDQLNCGGESIDVDDEPQMLTSGDVCEENSAVLVVDAVVDEAVFSVREMDD